MEHQFETHSPGSAHSAARLPSCPALLLGLRAKQRRGVYPALLPGNFPRCVEKSGTTDGLCTAL
eukprot:scaffold59056_cov17-Tisochrysis_lutea.AAC.1